MSCELHQDSIALATASQSTDGQPQAPQENSVSLATTPSDGAPVASPSSTSSSTSTLSNTTATNGVESVSSSPAATIGVDSHSTTTSAVVGAGIAPTADHSSSVVETSCVSSSSSSSSVVAAAAVELPPRSPSQPTQHHHQRHQSTHHSNSGNAPSRPRTSNTTLAPEDRPPNSRIFLGNLASESTTANDLRRIFGVYGNIIEEPVIRRSFGFIQYDNPEAARAAIAGQQGQSIGGMRLGMYTLPLYCACAGSILCVQLCTHQSREFVLRHTRY
jgi:hypothetical protein